MHKFNGLFNLKDCLVLADKVLRQGINEQNTVKITDFKIITTKKDYSTWVLTLIGPDNLPYIIQHPKLKFRSHQWHVSQHSKVMPWFFNELPEPLYLFLVQWWMRFIGYRDWKSNTEHSMYYTDLFGNLT